MALAWGQGANADIKRPAAEHSVNPQCGLMLICMGTQRESDSCHAQCVAANVITVMYMITGWCIIAARIRQTLIQRAHVASAEKTGALS